MQKFKEGDRVRVREWDDMAKEFGVKKYKDGYEIIKTPACFGTEMRTLCGETGIVNTVKKYWTKKEEDGSESIEQLLEITWDKLLPFISVMDIKPNPNCDKFDNGMFELAE